jgi:thiol:disulfide interchange protein
MLWAVLGAILGGILLNLMPCVFPILGLKALHISKAGESASEARRDSLAYTAGAIVGTGALGVALLAIRAAGAEAGWAFQLQDPRTIMLLLLLAVAITANLLGLFELPVLGGRAQPAGSFGTGALAAFIATPCAGPFLGVALGTALLLPVAGAVLVFAALGLGLAIPFLAVAFIPALRTRLPKPGAWMDRLKRFLAIPMGASAIAALWLLYRQAGNPALLFGIFAGAALVACLYFAGRNSARRSTPGRVRRASCPRRGDCCGRASACPGHRARLPGRGRRDMERSARQRRASARPSGVRLFHRRLVPDLQGQ